MSTWGRTAVAHRHRIGAVALWAVLAAPVAFARLTPPHGTASGLLLAGLLLLLALAAGTARGRPLVGLVVVLAGTSIDGNFVFALPVFSYLVGRHERRAGPAAGVFVVTAVAGTIVNLALPHARFADWFLSATALVFAGVLPWLLGRHQRQQRELVRTGWHYAEALEREQRGTAERVRLRERSRIAQDMHDSLGHDLSLLALRAGALELAADLPERHRAAAGELRASVAAATDRLREIIGVLQEEPVAAPTEPPDATVADLVAGAADAGMSVRLRTDDSIDGLPPLAGRTAYLVVREALTNAARYAPGAPVEVSVTGADRWVDVRVTNRAAPGGVGADGRSTGTGLLALHERVHLVGGTFDAGGHRDGFTVTARLPVRPVPARPDEPSTPAPGPVAGSPARYGLLHARRRARRSLLVAVATPAVLAGMLSLVYYPYVTVDAVLDRPSFDRMRPGQARADLPGLPRRQVAPPHPVRPGPPGSRCEYYTDGNFPFAQATYRLCFARDRLVAKDLIDTLEETG